MADGGQEREAPVGHVAMLTKLIRSASPRNRKATVALPLAATAPLSNPVKRVAESNAAHRQHTARID